MVVPKALISCLSDFVPLQSRRVSCAEIKDPFIYKPILIAVVMRFLQQLSGVTCVLVYLQPIFKKTAVILVSSGCPVIGDVCPVLDLPSQFPHGFCCCRSRSTMRLLSAWCVCSRWRLLLCRWIKLAGRFSSLCRVSLSATMCKGNCSLAISSSSTNVQEWEFNHTGLRRGLWWRLSS